MLNQNFTVQACFSPEKLATDYVIRFTLPEEWNTQSRSRPVNSEVIVLHLEHRMREAMTEIQNAIYRGDPI